METEPVLCKLCGQPLLGGDLVVPVRIQPGGLTEPEESTSGVHLKCVRPLPRENPPVPPTLTDEDIG
jgi:hypothetical protein